jgi:hypothetical protein
MKMTSYGIFICTFFLCGVTLNVCYRFASKKLGKMNLIK